MFSVYRLRINLVYLLYFDMLGLLNIDTAPQDWVDDIEHDILEVIS